MGKKNVFEPKNINKILSLKLIDILKEAKRIDWAIWVLCHIIGHKSYVLIAIYSAELVLLIYEKQHPKNKAAMEAIEAAKKCLGNPSKENKNASAAAVTVNVATDADVYKKNIKIWIEFNK